jgi:hypothetical protein
MQMPPDHMMHFVLSVDAIPSPDSTALFFEGVVVRIASGEFAEQLVLRLPRGHRPRHQLDFSPGLEHTADSSRPHCPRGLQCSR